MTKENERALNGVSGSIETPQDITVCIVGLGYVGLPLVVQFDNAGFDTIGYDIDSSKVKTLASGSDTTGDLGDEAIANSEATFTTDENSISQASYLIITVPTPIDDLENPNLSLVANAGETIGRNIKKGSTVILESTVYPGATRDILIPAIESNTEFAAGTDFFVGYSPERVVPGDDEHGVRDVVKIVSGQTSEVVENLAELYSQITDAGVHKSPTIEAAEAAKCLENIQRDLNIALVNELAVACDSLGLDTHTVLEAAGTKWNFHDYQPGLVGGHCIPVDPFFMIYEAKRNGFRPQLIETAREVNDYIPKHLSNILLRGLNDCEKALYDSTVLLMGLSYKPDVSDIRASSINGIINELDSFGIDIQGYDPYVENRVIRDEFSIQAQDEVCFEDIDGVLLATTHSEFLDIDYQKAIDTMNEKPLIVDVAGKLKGELKPDPDIEYRRL